MIDALCVCRSIGKRFSFMALASENMNNAKITEFYVGKFLSLNSVTLNVFL